MATKKAPASPKAKAKKAPKTPKAAKAGDDSYALLNKLLLHLQDVREKLMFIQPDELTESQHEEWNRQVYKVGLAIAGVRKAILQRLADQFQGQLPGLEAATDKLTDDLYELKSSVARIKAVGDVIGIFDSIISLVS